MEELDSEENMKKSELMVKECTCGAMAISTEVTGKLDKVRLQN